jgi:hypothetical protein
MQQPLGNHADLIIDRLWLGNAAASRDESFLRENNIRVVFNCTKDLPFHYSVQRQYRLPIDDNLQDEEIRNMELWSFELMAKLTNEYRAGNTILVHCAAGMQRSAATVAMFLIIFAKMTPEQAMAYIKNKRPIAFRPSANFERSIRGFFATVEKLRREGLSEPTHRREGLSKQEPPRGDIPYSQEGGRGGS